MQKARIITRSPEKTGHLADQLREHGYEVEIVAPNQKNLPHADLEIEVESCSVVEALDRAAELARADEGDVYVAAGCFHEEKVAASAEIAVPLRPTVADTVSGVAAGLQNKRDLLAKALREQRALMREARIAQRQRREQEAARQAAQQAERALLAKQAEAKRMAEEQKRIAFQQREIAAQRRIAQAEKAEISHLICLTESDTSYVPRPTPRTREWRLAFAIAAIFAAALTLGWSTAIRTRTSPLPPDMVNGHPSVEQQTPFGAATIRPPITPPPASIPATPRPAAKPSAIPRVSQSAPPKQAKAAGKASRVRHKYQSTKMDGGGAADVADDQTRRVAPPRTTPAQPRPQSPQNATLRRYSDME
jgi:hypothetical protein